MTAYAANIVLKDSCLMISGNLTFDSVVEVWDKSLPLIMQCSSLSFDFSEVTSSNSAGLALLLEWIKLAHQKNKKIIFKKIPPQLLSIAKVSGVLDLLGDVVEE